MTEGPDNLVLHLLREMQVDVKEVRSDLDDLRANMVTKAELADLRAELKSDIHSLRADVASDMLVMRKELGEQIVGLRLAVVEYHSSAIGHGILISELEARVRRLSSRTPGWRRWTRIEGRGAVRCG